MPCFLLASTDPAVEQRLLIVIVQLAVIIAAARLFANLFRRFRQPAVVGEIFAGVILGPSCCGALSAWAAAQWGVPDLAQLVFPPAAQQPEVNAAFGIVSQIGLILLLFLIGLEFDFSHLRVQGPAALAISITGVVLPLALGFGLALGAYPFLVGEGGPHFTRLGFTLFLGVAMSITAIPILGRMMIELGITRTRVGVITITAAAIDDACGWILLATIASMVQSGFDPYLTLRMVAASLAFFAGMVFVGRPLLKRFAAWALRGGREELSLDALAIMLIVLLLCALTTNLIGIFAIFGAFVCGTVLSDEQAFREAFGRQMRNFVSAFFLPIFFTYTGLRTNIGTLTTPQHWLLLLGVLASAIVGKFVGCAAAARWGGFSRREALCIGIMMNTRALMELIVINVGRDLGVIPDSVFCMLVLMALATTIMTTPLLLRFMPGSELEPFIQASGFLGGERARGDNGRGVRPE